MGKKRMKRKRDSSDNQPLRRSARLAGLPPSHLPGQREKTTLAAASPPSTSSTWFPTMRIVIAPPETFTAGVASVSPLVVSFEVDMDLEGKKPEVLAEDDISDCWFMLALVTADGQERLTPDRELLLTGKVVDSIHLSGSFKEGRTHTVGHASFENLVISDPGSYRFRILVINSSMESPTILRRHDSIAFDVLEHAQEQNITQASLSSVREVGVEI